MKKKKLEDNPEVKKRIEQEETIEKKDFVSLLKKAVKPKRIGNQEVSTEE